MDAGVKNEVYDRGGVHLSRDGSILDDICLVKSHAAYEDVKVRCIDGSFTSNKLLLSAAVPLIR